MAKKKSGFDSKKIQKLLKERVEILALGVCGLLMVLFIVVGVGQALSASSPDRKIKEAAQSLAGRVDNAAADSSKDRMGLPEDWVLGTDPERFAGGEWFDAAAPGDTKKRNPVVLALDAVAEADKEKYIQVDVLPAGVRRYEIDPRGQISVLTGPDKGGKGAAALAEKVNTERLVVVHATFPYRQQMEEFRKALRVDKVEDLYPKGLQPTFAGLNVWRGERAPGAKEFKWMPIYLEKDGKVTASLADARLLTTAVYDEDQRYAHLIPPGAGTPLPKLADADYPPVELPGIVGRGLPLPKGKVGAPPPVGKTAVPPGPGKKVEAPKDPDLSGVPMPLSRAIPDTLKPFRNRLSGNVNYFHPFGLFADAKDVKGAVAPGTPGVRPPGGDQIPGEGGTSEMSGGQGAATAPFVMSDGGKALVRFVDTDVKPDHTYQYAIQVRLVNPNYGHTKDVAFAALAEQKELLSRDFALTPEATVPRDFYFYVVDVPPKSLVSKVPPSTIHPFDNPNPLEKVAVQIHKWVHDIGGRSVADWVIAERLLLARGETISRAAVEVEVPVWNYVRGIFQLGEASTGGKGKPGAKTIRASLPVDFEPPSGDSPVIVDFEGGKAVYPTYKDRADEGTLEVLLFGPDGRVFVRNSRDDSDPEADTGSERLDRYEAWKARLTLYRQQPPPNAPLPPGGGGDKGNIGN